MTNGTSCPGCGAPVRSYTCEYCGRDLPRLFQGNPLTYVAPALWSGSCVQASQSTMDVIRRWQAQMAYDVCGKRSVWRP